MFSLNTGQHTICIVDYTEMYEGRYQTLSDIFLSKVTSRIRTYFTVFKGFIIETHKEHATA